jgi:hypothetical protein
MKKRIIVDVQTHIVVPLWAEALINAGVIEFSGSQVVFRWRGISHTQSDEFIDIEKQMRVCAEAGITHRMLHTPMILTFINEVLGTPVMEVARIHNDYMAELQQQHPGILFPYGTVKPHEGLDGLLEQSRRSPRIGNRVPIEIEQRVLDYFLQYPTHGQTRTANELKLQGVVISASGVRSLWLRHNLHIRSLRLKRLEAWAAENTSILTESQVKALEEANEEQEVYGEVESSHPAFLVAQDTCYIGTIKGVRPYLPADRHRYSQ